MASNILQDEAFESRYQLITKLGEGGFGEVYQARQLATGQLVAVKVLRQRDTGHSSETKTARFRREAKTCAGLYHPHIVRLIDSGRADDKLYTVFEFVPGKNLAEVLHAEGALSPAEAVHLMSQVLDALGCAHAMGVVHRDLKPHNIMVTTAGIRRNAVVLDFGISTMIEAAWGEDFGRLTATNEVLGTPAYAAPEQLRGAPPTPRSDLYSWGLVMAECLTGERVMMANNLMDMVSQQLDSTPVSLPATVRHHRLGRLLQRVLCKEVMTRDVSAKTILSELDRMSIDATALQISSPRRRAQAVPIPDPDELRGGTLVADRGRLSAQLMDSPTLHSQSGEIAVDAVGEQDWMSAQFAGDKFELTVLCARLVVTPVADLDTERAPADRMPSETTALDTETYDSLLRAQKDLFASIAARHAGQMSASIGDCAIVHFGYPRAHEDDPRRAVRVALEFIEESARRSLRAESEQGVRLQVRLGLHTGPMIIYPASLNDMLGLTAHIAAHLCTLASPGTILCSDTAWGVLRRHFIATPAGSVQLLGVTEALSTYVLAPAHSALISRTLDAQPRNPLYGREAELALLRQRWKHARKNAGQGVLVTGEPGIGKSRLTRELRSTVTGGGYRWLECRCAPESRNSALQPIVEMVENIFGFSDDNDTRKAEKLATSLARFGLQSDDALPLFARLLAIDLPTGLDVTVVEGSVQELQDMTLNVLLSLLFELAEQQPTVFVVEDLHWADPTTIKLLGLLLQEIASAPLMGLFTARPAFTSPWPNLLQIELLRLEPPDIAELVSVIAGGKALPEEIVKQLVHRTDGVPLFVEELTRMLLDSKVVELRDGRYVLVGELDEHAIPTTLRGSLTARLDRLGAAKKTAQMGAAIGREFRLDILEATRDLPSPELQSDLDALVDADLIHRRGRRRNQAYVFRHALICDAAYESMTTPQRRTTHARIAEILTSQFSHLTQSRPELLAHHLVAAGERARAVPHILTAANRALQASANVEAIAYAEQGLALVDALEDQRAETELALNVILTSGLMSTRGWADPQIVETVQRSQDLVDQVGESPHVEPTLFALLMYHHCTGHRHVSREMAERVLEHLRDQDDKLVAALPVIGNCLWIDGDMKKSLTVLDRTLELYDFDTHGSYRFGNGIDSRAYATMTRAEVLWRMGRADSARATVEDAVRWSEEIDHPPSMAASVMYEFEVFQKCGQRAAAGKAAERGFELCEKHGLQGMEAYFRVLVGWSRRDPEMIEGSLSLLSALGLELGRTYFHSLAIDLALERGEFEESAARLDELLSWARSTGEVYYIPELLRMRSRALVAHGDTETAEQLLRDAIADAKKSDGDMLALRAAVDLHNLLVKHGQDEQGRTIVTEIFQRFSEGFDTAFVADAKEIVASRPQ